MSLIRRRYSYKMIYPLSGTECSKNENRNEVKSKGIILDVNGPFFLYLNSLRAVHVANLFKKQKQELPYCILQVELFQMISMGKHAYKSSLIFFFFFFFNVISWFRQLYQFDCLLPFKIGLNYRWNQNYGIWAHVEHIIIGILNTGIFQWD